jgi:uncharacterized protein YhaN
VQFERLVIESGQSTFALDLHSRVTVVAGVGRLERDGLINELVAAIGTGHPGVHLELASDAGTRYTIYRPVGGAHRVVDIDHEQDVTDSFVGPSGAVNLLERAGLDERTARRQMRITEADLATTSTQEEYVLTLAHVEQGRLWDVAWKVKDREDRLNEVAEAAGSTAHDAEAFEEVERRHRDFEEAQEQHERVRHIWFMVGGITAISVVPAAMVAGGIVAIPLMVAAIATTVASIVFWNRLEAARKREQEALTEAGALSYLNFQINRVNTLVSIDKHRVDLMQAAEYHRAAVIEWKLLAGDIPVDWAIAHRREVRQAATRLRHTIGGVRNPMALTLSETEETTADVADAMLARLREMRTLGAGGESFPAFLDDPFVNLPSAAKPGLLELLVAASRDQQIIYLTQDPDVAEWARLEALTGELAIVEPGSGRRPGGDDNTPKRSRHVAA